ncbi:endonuclease/exonuclease/phosphatase family protein [Sphingobacterium sp.]|uniref:endonuclease/exonuclease/phosphatase family protein n=1 Tax=Sphingobacterium sp. TaxID=341027 RepID=UPI0028A244D6|nr:endonuclease/exonuclease/phosphatase family protein [Sphingobacterium sp.]
MKKKRSLEQAIVVTRLMDRRTFLRRKLGFISKTMFLANMLAIIALLMSYSATFINPKSFWPIAFMGLGYLPILIVNIGFICYWLLRKRKIALYSLATILIGWPFLTKHWNIRKENPPISSEIRTLRIMTFNAHLFKKVDNEKKNFKADVVRIIDSISPDVICFQEYISKIKGKHVFSEEFKDKLGYDYFYFEPSSKNEYEAYGMAVLSRFPIYDSGTIRDNDYGINRISYVDIKKQDTLIRVYNIHLRSFALQNEDKEFIQNLSNKNESDNSRTRKLSRKLKNAFELRSEQAHSLKKHMNECQYPYIAVGDFNDTPMSYSVNLIGEGLFNAFKEKGNGWGVTHHALLPIFQIDYIFASQKFQIMNYQIVKQKLSDHYPVWSDLRLKP